MDTLFSFRELFALIFFLSVIRKSAESEGKQIVITVPSGKVTRRVDEDLNLTCRVTAKETYSISWDIPQNKQLQVDRIKTEDKFNEQSVTIYRLGEVDTGMYTCTAQHDKTVLKQIVYVSVSSQAGKRSCFENPFVCGNGFCIPKRYTCDGHIDCPDGADEAQEICGPDPCKDKVLCDEGRCLPRSFCCDPVTQRGCRLTYLLPCCRKYLASIANASMVNALAPHQRFGASVEYLQSSVYTVVSCAVVFILVATVMVAAICRIHMRRSVMATAFPITRGPAPRCLPWCRHLHHPSTTAVTFPDVAQSSPASRFPSRLACPHLSAGSGNLRTVTCAHGSYVVAAYSSAQDGAHAKVHFFQHLPKPPEYSPMVECPPPPPYRSVDDLSQAKSGNTGTDPTSSWTQHWEGRERESPPPSFGSDPYTATEDGESERLLPPYTASGGESPSCQALSDGDRRAST